MTTFIVLVLLKAKKKDLDVFYKMYHLICRCMQW